jgi:predicted RNA methylase
MMERLLVSCPYGLCAKKWVNCKPVNQDIKRKFDTIVDLGAGAGHFSKLLEPDKARKVIMIDSSGSCQK